MRMARVFTLLELNSYWLAIYIVTLPFNSDTPNAANHLVEHEVKMTKWEWLSADTDQIMGIGGTREAAASRNKHGSRLRGVQ